MAPNKMLIDATHPEETRVVVLRNGRVEEFDYESAARKLLRGNIYLAKVTRVEPSLQAAFVDYGGNRHGFLAFNEIHPDYYQIPVADRQALLDEEAAAEAEEEAAADARAERLARRQRRHEGGHGSRASEDAGDEHGPEEAGAEAPHDHDDHDHHDGHNHDDHEGDDHHDAAHDGDEAAHSDDSADEPGTIAQVVTSADDVIVEEVGGAEEAGGFEGDDDGEGAAEEAEASSRDVSEGPASAEGETSKADAAPGDHGEGGVQVVAAASAEAEAVEQVGSEDALEELPSRPRRRPRSYKIQEVIKRRQVILVQVVKEERGNKGAALTTYLSLAGRYTVLMPNTARGGGISRKITNPQDRKRLKAIAQELEVPEGMGLIIRTAGAARTKQEIKRDFEYLLRLWESVRDLTLQSTAPSLVYEEGNLIKRSIRDLYNKDVEEIVVAGEHAHKDAKDFMRMLMPSHAKNVLQHQDSEPLFTKYGIERQLNAMFSPYVTLKSGGYLVINQTEALVSIDVNSGKATREFSIEETALNTNLEACDEVARQLKLRDLAGLVVIDFIDMEEKRNNRAVERRLKDALRFDRARIQLGRISHFGLMEMSRQRLRTGVLEGSTSQCPHCQGTGIIRSTESVALAVLRGLEDALMAGARTSLIATTTAQVALYILNNKRQFINEMEARHGISVQVQASDKLQGANFTIEKGHAAPVQARRPDRTAVNMDWGFEGEASDAPEAEQGGIEEVESDAPEQSGGDRDREGGPRGDGQREGGRRRRRRRGRRGGGDRERFEGRGGDDRRSEGGREHDHHPEGAHDHDADSDEGDVVTIGGEGGDYDEGHADEAGGSETGARGEPRAPQGGRDDGNGGGRRRRRGRRGGRRGRDRDRSRENGGAPGVQAEGAPASFEGGAEDDSHGDFEDADRSSAPSNVSEEHEAPETRVVEPRREPGVKRVEPKHSEPKHAEPVRSERAASPPQPAPAAEEPQKSEEPVRSRRGQVTSSEPKIERVVVSPDRVEGGDAGAAPAEPARRGWWQKRLGS